MNLPLIDKLDLRFPEKYFGRLDSDPCDFQRSLNHIHKRRQRVNLPTLTDASLYAIMKQAENFWTKGVIY